MTFRNSFVAASAIALALTTAPAFLGLAQPAGAQTTETQAPETVMPEAQATTEFSEQDLDAFVVALIEVNALHASFTERLDQAADEAEQTAIVEEGNAAIVAAINEVDGMDTQLYASILDRAGVDAELNADISQRVEAATVGG